MGIQLEGKVSFIFLFRLILSGLIWFNSAVLASNLPEPPRRNVDIPNVPQKGEIHFVRNGEGFQRALDNAESGDVILLEAGTVFVGPFVLPVKKGSDWITVRTSIPDQCPETQKCNSTRNHNQDTGKQSFPLPGKRIGPEDAHLMPKLVSDSGPVIQAAPGAHHYRFIGLEIYPIKPRKQKTSPFVRSVLTWVNGIDPDTELFADRTLVLLGSKETSIDTLPHHIIVDRCYIHGDEIHGSRRGIALNSTFTAVVNSHLSNFKAIGLDSQAIAGWNGAGPFRIENNYLEGAGENIIFGGADPHIKNLVPADIVIKGNHIAKPLSWKISSPSYEGKPWTIKNLLELKNARRVKVEGNFFEYNWHHAQTGFAILFTVRNQNGKSPWSVVSDVIFTNNVIRHVGGGIDILGYDDNHPSNQTSRILVKNNLFYDVGGIWGDGRLYQIRDGTSDIVIQDNTNINTGSIIMVGGKNKHKGFIFTGNIALHNEYGIKGSGFETGNPTIEHFFPDSHIRQNIIVGGDPALYPENNYFPSTTKELGFSNGLIGDYRLNSTNSLRNLIQAKEKFVAGVDFYKLCNSLKQVLLNNLSLRFCNVH